MGAKRRFTAAVSSLRTAYIRAHEFACLPPAAICIERVSDIYVVDVAEAVEKSGSGNVCNDKTRFSERHKTASRLFMSCYMIGTS